MVPFRRAFEIHRAPGPKIHSLLARVLASFANRVEAMAWLEPFRNRQVVYPPGWQVSIYQIGDEGYLAKYKDGGRFEIEFREVQCATKSHGGRRDRIRSIRYGSLTDDSSKADVRLRWRMLSHRLAHATFQKTYRVWSKANPNRVMSELPVIRAAPISA